MIISAVLTLIFGVPHIKNVPLTSLQEKSSLGTTDALLKYISALGLEATAVMTWIPSREGYRGRRAFYLSCNDASKTLVCEIGFIAWTNTDDKANMAAMLVSGGYFVSPLYSNTTDSASWKTLSQYWPRRGPNRWEVYVIAHSGSSIIKLPVVERIFDFFGESLGKQ